MTEGLLDQSEGLDPDELGGTDDVYDPPEDWSEADKYGMTAREARDGESVARKLARDVPDNGA